MYKSMAVIDGDGVVVNIINCSKSCIETNELKEIFDKSVEIGDLYDNGRYYRCGKEVLSVIEEYQISLNNACAALEALGVQLYD